MSLCIAGCGFYGKAETGGMCSVCYRQLTGGSAAPSTPGAKGAAAVSRASVIVGGTTLEVCYGDMTKETSDCIVNAANSTLDHASGLAGAISKTGGRIIQEESDLWIATHGRLQDGEVAITHAGTLPCKWVIHAVGPMWHGGAEGEEIILGMAVHSSLSTADSKGLNSISLPAISSGVFGFPKDRCANVMVDSVVEYLNSKPSTTLRNIRFTNFDEPTVQYFLKSLLRVKPTAPATATPIPTPTPIQATPAPALSITTVPTPTPTPTPPITPTTPIPTPTPTSTPTQINSPITPEPAITPTTAPSTASATVPQKDTAATVISPTIITAVEPTQSTTPTSTPVTSVQPPTLPPLEVQNAPPSTTEKSS
ncbi:Appr-1-p processing protein [Pelomyxa schiedti]|nr:Appr-1-p processing protein [Pelomyxa schiedti]